jgi:coatomer subunit alpha
MWIKNGRLCGNVVIGYLKKKGHPEVALHFVEEPQTRFNLALEYGHIAEAMKAVRRRI